MNKTRQWILAGVFALAAASWGGFRAAAAGTGVISDPCTTGAQLQAAIMAAAPGGTICLTGMTVSNELDFSGSPDIDVTLASPDSSKVTVTLTSGVACPHFGFNFSGDALVSLNFENVAIDGGGAVPPPTGVSAGSRIAAPKAPARAGYKFAGWYRDAAGTVPWDFAANAVTGDITLYAKWAAVRAANPKTGDVSFPAAALPASLAALTLLLTAKRLGGGRSDE